MTLTTVNPALLDTQAQYTGFKNRIINGNMVIDQRNAGASVSYSITDAYTLDRFFIGLNSGGGVLSVQRSTTAPEGYTNSALITVTTADTSLGTTDLYEFGQRIEGFNIADLGWGTANAKPVTLSFQVRSSVTGTYSIGFCNADASRSYVATYVVNAANTFETKTITVSGDTSGTWNTGNTIGMQLRWCLATGTNRVTASANTWESANRIAISATANPIMGTSGATFYITGVQLEKGSTATSFDYRPYGTELALCQRYYQRVSGFVCGTGTNTGACGASVMYKTEMRASPSVGLTATLVVTQAQTSDFTQSSASALIAAGGTRVNSLGVSLDFANFTGLPNNTPLPAIVTGGILTLSSEL